MCGEPSPNLLEMASVDKKGRDREVKADTLPSYRPKLILFL